MTTCEVTGYMYDRTGDADCNRPADHGSIHYDAAREMWWIMSSDGIVEPIGDTILDRTWLHERTI